MQRPLDQTAAEQYPDYLEWEGVKYPLSYEFEPTSERDGVTLKVPLMALKQIPSRRLEWLVPGLLRENASHWLKACPNPCAGTLCRCLILSMPRSPTCSRVTSRWP